ncbi:DUF1439 domain-containing protein [Marinobacter sp. M216]|uniref:DUF1439 domain-containing protein n=1 Tax=Marinobacter albus TaxID=3030833 RepID=A0ABT7HH85_9GAMM|nr:MULTISPECIES: DUF1439 domain-containing protein [unclassified Marinobacter]MBW7472714.1 DUF1439 domain-containing protein [Marinobacter sp. F4218]MDK9559267.1 DUF1439 domain-containing protein [Marinobacter sp. M216]
MLKLPKTGLWALVFMVVGLTSGCASFSPYSISEGELERHLQDVVRDFDRQQLQSGSPLSLSLNDADITLGPDGRDVAVIDVKGQIAVNALLAKLPVDIALKVEGAPVYDSTEKAIFIRRLQLLESNIESPYFKGDLKPVTDTVMRAVAQMLETMPVYRLDETDFAQRMFGAMPVDVRVAPGRLEFVMADQ